MRYSQLHSTLVLLIACCVGGLESSHLEGFIENSKPIGAQTTELKTWILCHPLILIASECFDGCFCLVLIGLPCKIRVHDSKVRVMSLDFEL